MKLFLRIIFLVFFVGCSTMSGGGQTQLRNYEIEKLENGLKILFVEEHSLPSFSLSVLVDAGVRHDQKATSGLSQMVAGLLGKGTKTQTANQLVEELDFIAADFSSSASLDYVQMSASTLAFNKDKLIDLFSEILLQPTFPVEEVERIRKQMLAEGKNIIDSPSAFISRAAYQDFFMETNYGLPVGGTQAGLKAIRKRDINRYYLKHYRPSNSILAVVGQFDSKTKKKIKDTFSQWQRGKQDEADRMSFPKLSGRQVTLINKQGATQAQVRLLTPGISRKHPDYLELRLANVVLGGAFASRLNDRIRVELGLTYGVSSFFDTLQERGPFLISSFTRSEKVGELVSEAISILEKLTLDGISEQELDEAKGLLLGRFPQAIETAEKLAFNVLLLEWYGVSHEYLSEFNRKINRISVKDVNRAIKEGFRPADMKIIVYGDAKEISDQLKVFGPLEKKAAEKFL